MKSFLLAALMLCNINLAAHAQGSNPPPNAIVIKESKRVEVRKKKAPAKSDTVIQQTYTAPTSPVPAAPTYAAPNVSAPSTSAPGSTSTAAAAPIPNPWTAVLFTEYFGPRFSNIDLEKSQGPNSATPVYTKVDYSAKVLYQLHKNHRIGMQIRARSPFDPARQFFFKNLRLVGTWGNMIDTPHIGLSSALDVEIPTTSAAREEGNLLNLNIKFNWNIKTTARNWSFSVMTMLRPSFFDDPTAKSDLYVGVYPWVTYDLAPDWQLIFEGNFDAAHQYNSAFFDLNTTEGMDDPDFIRTGVGYNFNKNVSINPAMQWWLADISFKAAVFYMSLTAAL